MMYISEAAQDSNFDTIEQMIQNSSNTNRSPRTPVPDAQAMLLGDGHQSRPNRPNRPSSLTRNNVSFESSESGSEETKQSCPSLVARCCDTSFGCRQSSYWLAPRICICLVVWTGAAILFGGLVLFLQGRFIDPAIFLPLSTALMGIGGGLLFMGFILCCRGYLAIRITSSDKKKPRKSCIANNQKEKQLTSSSRKSGSVRSAHSNNTIPYDSATTVNNENYQEQPHYQLQEQQQQQPRPQLQQQQSQQSQQSQDTKQRQYYENQQSSTVNWADEQPRQQHQQRPDRSPIPTPRQSRTPASMSSFADSLNKTPSLRRASSQQQEQARRTSKIIIQYPSPKGRCKANQGQIYNIGSLKIVSLLILFINHFFLVKAKSHCREVIVTSTERLPDGTEEESRQVIIVNGWQSGTKTRLSATQSCKDLNKSDQDSPFYVNLPNFTPNSIRRKSYVEGQLLPGETDIDQCDCSFYQTLPSNWPTQAPKPAVRRSLQQQQPQRSLNTEVFSDASESSHRRSFQQRSIESDGDNRSGRSGRSFMPRGPVPLGGPDDMLHQAFLMCQETAAAGSNRRCSNPKCGQGKAISSKSTQDLNRTVTQSASDQHISKYIAPGPVQSNADNVTIGSGPRSAFSPPNKFQGQQMSLQQKQQDASKASSGSAAYFYSGDPAAERLVSVRLTRAVSYFCQLFFPYI